MFKYKLTDPKGIEHVYDYDVVLYLGKGAALFYNKSNLKQAREDITNILNTLLKDGDKQAPENLNFYGGLEND